MDSNDNLTDMLQKLIGSGKMPADLLIQIREAMADPTKVAALLEAFKAIGADEGPSPPLDIAEFYHDAPGKYEERWKIAAPLPLPFSQLDRKSQFFVLFQEWSRREFDGMLALNNGNLKLAGEIFQECLERAQQIDVGELEARSYEDMARVAERLGDRSMQRDLSQKATQARAA